MVAYGIGFLPLIKCLKAAYPDVAQTWYADEAGELGTFDNIGLYFNLLKKIGLGSGYYPKPSKSVLIMHLDNSAEGKELGVLHRFKVCTGTRYLGSFIGGNEPKREWLKYWTLKW